MLGALILYARPPFADIEEDTEDFVGSSSGSHGVEPLKDISL